MPRTPRTGREATGGRVEVRRARRATALRAGRTKPRLDLGYFEPMDALDQTALGEPDAPPSDARRVEPESRTLIGGYLGGAVFVRMPAAEYRAELAAAAAKGKRLAPSEWRMRRRLAPEVREALGL